MREFFVGENVCYGGVDGVITGKYSAIDGYRYLVTLVTGQIVDVSGDELQ